jgi:hypothetical protein
MITEAELRDAFAARVSEVPGGAARRLRQLDYRPRPHLVLPPLAFGALAGAAGAAALAISIVGLGTSAPSAFAGWTPAPTRPRRHRRPRRMRRARRGSMANRLLVSAQS